MAGALDFSEVTWVLGAVLIGTLVYYVKWMLTPKYSGLNIPPFPGPKRLITGHLHLWDRNPDLKKINKFRQDVGDLFSLDLSGKLIVVVNGYENMKEVLVNHSKEAADRPATPMERVLDEDNRGVLYSHGENWKPQRSAAVAILRNLGMGKNIMAEKIGEEVEIFMNKIASYNGEPVDFRVPINISISNIICAMICGTRFDYDDPFFKKLLQNLDAFLGKAPDWILLSLLPFLQYLPGDLIGIKAWANHAHAVRKDFLEYQVNEHKKLLSKGEYPETFITSYLQRMEKERESKGVNFLNEKDLIASLRALYLGGTDTTSTTIYWCVLFCLHRPEVQEKVFKEISTHVGEARFPNLSDRPNLKYLEAVMKETMRLANVLPMFLRHVTESFDMKGYTIPKDTMLLLNYTSILQDTKPWGDPDKFRPERFLDADGNLITTPEELMPFGIGKRMCVGEALAKMELYMYLSAMFQRFRFEPEDLSGNLPPLDGKIRVVHVPENYKVRFVERSQ